MLPLGTQSYIVDYYTAHLIKKGFNSFIKIIFIILSYVITNQ